MPAEAPPPADLAATSRIPTPTTPADADAVADGVAEAGRAARDEPWVSTDHFAANLAASELLISARRCLAIAPLTGAVRSRAGFASTAAILQLVDVSTSHPTMIAVRPDWTATQDISVYGGGRIMDGPVVVDSRLVRAGKKVAVAESDIYDAHGVDDPHELHRMLGDATPAGRPGADVEGLTRAGRALVTFARLPRISAPGMDDYDPGKWVGTIRSSDHVVERPADHIQDALGAQLLDAATGQFELHRTPYVTNSIGTILGGAQAALVEAAAEAMCPGAVAIDLQMHFLAQLRSGPARTVGQILRDSGDHWVVSVTVVDAGADDLLLTLATVTLQRTSTDLG
ncbi:hypothetical protein MXD61_16260 [Frankia sp. AgPm24]|uniref:Thioesterase domain-containing protein n=1 Tax=Frankia umida TaxID=573489 RepID=A0ABT0JUD3_9ACTN|nr:MULTISPECIES: hypothetical protein [Frankia]MCK9875158.1 hypothetical protein [Frankia umida]MCK9923403.1 hypothetical protein [Frankia sp. AgPm24]